MTAERASTVTERLSRASTCTLPLEQVGAKLLDAVSAIADANQRIVGELIGLGSMAAAEPLRAIGEMQSAAMEAARSTLPSAGAREAFDEFRKDPLAWYGKSMVSALDGAQRILKLLETNTQIVAKSAERFQGSAEKNAKEIEQAARACASRLRELYA